jgi:hypothetical protein
VNGLPTGAAAALAQGDFEPRSPDPTPPIMTTPSLFRAASVAALSLASSGCWFTRTADSVLPSHAPSSAHAYLYGRFTARTDSLDGATSVPPIAHYAANMWLKCEKGGVIGLHFDDTHTIGLFEFDPSRCFVSGSIYLAADNWPNTLLTARPNAPARYPAHLTLEPGQAYYVGDMEATVYVGKFRPWGQVRYYDKYEETTREIRGLFPGFERVPTSKRFFEEGQ